MKKAFVTLVLVCAATINAMAFVGDDKPVSVDKLPAAAKQFIQTHFSDVEISYAKQDGDMLEKDYEVVFINGNKIDFTKKGEWKDIDCKFSRVPMAIIPQGIANFVTKSHKNLYIIEIDRDSRDYEVKLNNEMELKFDLNGNFISYE